MSPTARRPASRFDSPQQEAYLALWRTYDRLRSLEDEHFAEFEMTLMAADLPTPGSCHRKPRLQFRNLSDLPLNNTSSSRSPVLDLNRCDKLRATLGSAATRENDRHSDAADIELSAQSLPASLSAMAMSCIATL